MRRVHPDAAIQDERAVNLISTQVAGLLGNADVNDDGLTTLAELDDFLRDTYRAVWKSTSASGAPDNSSLSHFSATMRPC